MAKQSNINAIIGFGQQIAGTLQNIQQQRWLFALEKAKMSREERIRQDEMSFARKAAASLAKQKQAEAVAKQQAGRQSLLGKLIPQLLLSDEQKQQVLKTGTFTGRAEARPTEHISRQLGGRGAGLQDPKRILINEVMKLKKKDENINEFLIRIKDPKEGMLQVDELLQRLLRTPSIIDMIQGFGQLGQPGQEAPPAGLQ